MKKVVPIVVSMFLLFPLSAHASISTKVDKVGGTAYVSQVENSGPWSSIEVKSTKNNIPTITLTKTDYLYYLFSNKTQLITDDSVSDLNLVEAYQTPTGYRTKFASNGVFELTPSQVAEIKNAQSVSFRVSFSNSSDIKWKVPSKILNEWKEVISKAPNQGSL